MKSHKILLFLRVFLYWYEIATLTAFDFAREGISLDFKGTQGSINLFIFLKNEVSIKCKGNVRDISDLLPKINETMIREPIIFHLRENCPLPNSFFDLSSKIKQLETLTYVNANLPRIASNKFAGLNILKTLELTNSSIKFIETKAFDGLPKLEFIDLSSNFISVITTNTFQQNLFLNVID
jgi:hypothetical protein